MFSWVVESIWQRASRKEQSDGGKLHQLGIRGHILFAKLLRCTQTSNRPSKVCERVARGDIGVEVQGSGRRMPSLFLSPFLFGEYLLRVA
jgi:hypothetical protein